MSTKLNKHTPMIREANSVEFAIGKVISLMSAGNLNAAANECRVVVKKFPKKFKVWHLKGVIAYRLGFYSDAVTALRQAIESGGASKAQIYCDLGASLNAQNQYQDAVEVFQQAIEIEPQNPLIYNNLGNALKMLAQDDEAIRCFQKAIALDPSFAIAMNNLGLAMVERGDFAEAVDIFSQALNINHKFADAINNLGAALWKLKRFPDALERFELVASLEPQSAEYAFNLGAALLAMNLHDRAEIALRNSIALNVKLAKSYSKLGWLLQKNGRYSCAIEQYKPIASLQCSEWDWAFMLAGLNFLLDDLHEAELSLAFLTPCLSSPRSEHKSAIAYFNYLTSLFCSWKKINYAAPIGACELPRVVHVFGESHALSAHNVKAYYFMEKATVQFRTIWCPGIKMWHLANTQLNEQKYQFKVFLDSLPIDSSILLMIGEIDCRPLEGIWQAAIKMNMQVQHVVAETVDGYLMFLDTMIHKNKFKKVLIQGVLAPAYLIEESLHACDIQNFLDMFSDVNERLKAGVLLRGWSFLDVYSATVADNGRGICKWHLDGWHLSPSFYREAAMEYVIDPPLN